MKKIFMFVNVDWFFLSHRLCIAQAAKRNNIIMSVYSEITQSRSSNFKNFSMLNSPLTRKSSSYIHLIIEIFSTFFLIKKNSPDLIHAVTIKPIIILGLISRITGTPFIGAFSGLGPAFNPKNWRQRFSFKLLIKILKIIFRNNRALAICQSKHDRQIIIDLNISSSGMIEIIPGSGVDTRTFSPNLRKENVQEYVLMSSRILFDKGIREYCLASNIVSSKINKKLNFFLSGPLDYESPSHITDSELSNFLNDSVVEYLGDRKDMPDLLASATLFVLPSYYPEGIPKVILEASSSGIPVITTDHPGCRDSIVNNKTGILIPVNDAYSLAEAMLTLISNKELACQMGAEGRELAVSEFNEADIINLHYKIYKKLLVE
ncbi:MAG: glycosyltransferase family 4 protein [Gammaproteobacteria bacterium]